VSFRKLSSNKTIWKRSHQSLKETQQYDRITIVITVLIRQQKVVEMKTRIVSNCKIRVKKLSKVKNITLEFLYKLRYS